MQKSIQPFTEIGNIVVLCSSDHIGHEGFIVAKPKLCGP
jgi:hypothetical protein